MGQKPWHNGATKVSQMTQTPMSAPPGLADLEAAHQATTPGAPGHEAGREAARTADVTGIAAADTVRPAVRPAFEDLKLVLDPSGAIAIAARLSGGVDRTGKTITAMAPGGNIAPERFAELLAA